MSESMGTGGDGGRGKRGGRLFDDLAGVASGAFSALAGVRAEVEAAARSQVEALVQRLDLVKREELDAALEVARRAREGQEALEARVAALEAKLAAPQPPVSAPPEPRQPPEVRTEAAPDGF
jgi:BMFP domain-containing protein YqiC